MNSNSSSSSSSSSKQAQLKNRKKEGRDRDPYASPEPVKQGEADHLDLTTFILQIYAVSLTHRHTRSV